MRLMLKLCFHNIWKYIKYIEFSKPILSNWPKHDAYAKRTIQNANWDASLAYIPPLSTCLNCCATMLSPTRDALKHAQKGQVSGAAVISSLGTSAFCHRMMGFKPQPLYFQPSFLLLCTLGSYKQWLKTWLPATHVGHLVGVPGSWHWSNSVLNTADTCQVVSVLVLSAIQRRGR